MGARSVAAALFASMIFSVAAWAAPPPDSVLFAGFTTPNTVNPTANGTWCMVEGATSTFVTSQTPVATVISFSEIIYTTTGSVGPTAYRLAGAARLVFNAGSSTDGKIYFDAQNFYAPGIYHPAFSGYTQSYNANTHTLSVQLNIAFAGCTLPVAATYRD
jgi:hypothetical protein